MSDLSLEMQGIFPGRGRGWRQWEDAFLQDFAAELGLRLSAEQLRRPPAEVALRISWLGVRLPEGKASLAKVSPAPKLAKKPQAVPHARAEAPEGWMTCAKIAELAGCTVGVVYSAIWKKKLDAVQGDRGVWLIPAEAAEEYLWEHGKPQMPENAPVRPVEAKEGDGTKNLPSKEEDAPGTPLEAQNGHVPEKPAEEISTDLPLATAKPAEADATSPERGASPQAMDLGSMSKLDILRAIASGKMEAGSAG